MYEKNAIRYSCKTVRILENRNKTCFGEAHEICYICTPVILGDAFLAPYGVIK